MAQSSSSIAGSPITQKWVEAITFLHWRIKGSKKPQDFSLLFQEISDYRSSYESLTGKLFDSARVLEIGYGQRPFRLIALMSMGIDVRGIDMDAPMLDFSPRQLVSIFKMNGWERTLKTAVRSLLFDRNDRVQLRNALTQRGYNIHLDRHRFLIGDASEYDYGCASFDFVYSEDVFEHIKAASLEELLAKMAKLLSPHGIMVTTPNIFTGIAGGHLPEWYPHLVDIDIQRKCGPWEHLLQKRYTANTYLNQLSRIDYRSMFERYFDIIEEKVIYPNLGRCWLTPGIREELRQWDDDELFSNKVRFVLRPRPY